MISSFWYFPCAFQTMIKVDIYTNYIKLKDALKFCGQAESGAAAKQLIENGQIKVNGNVCLVPGKKLQDGDTFEIFDKAYRITHEN